MRTKVSVPKTNVILLPDDEDALLLLLFITCSNKDVFCENNGAFVNITPQSFGILSTGNNEKKLIRRSTSEGSNGGLSALVTLISKRTVGSYVLSVCWSTVSHTFFKIANDDDEDDEEDAFDANDSSDEYRELSFASI